MVVRVAEEVRWSQPHPLVTVGGVQSRAATGPRRYEAGANSSDEIHSVSDVACLLA